MKLIMIIVLSIILVSCSTIVPVSRNFPSVPPIMLEKCEELKKIEKSNVVLSEVIKSIVDNYTLYHECALRNTIWIEWYKANKKIFEDIK